jgi:hypothetical protein
MLIASVYRKSQSNWQRKFIATPLHVVGGLEDVARGEAEPIFVALPQRKLQSLTDKPSQPAPAP